MSMMIMIYIGVPKIMLHFLISSGISFQRKIKHSAHETRIFSAYFQEI